MNASPLSVCQNRASKRKRTNAAASLHGIERLSDDILIVILSYLSFKEAVRNSVLSRRWSCLWRFTSGTLEFDYEHWLSKNHYTRIKVTHFESWVNRVIQLHRGPSVDKFIIRCRGKNKNSPNRVCNWLHFAMQKHVRVFELDVSSFDYFPNLDKFLTIAREVKAMDHIGLSSLTSLRLSRVKITAEMITFLSSNCACLQHLCLQCISGIKNLNIISPSLKSLIITGCFHLGNLAIFAENLVSFEFSCSVNFDWNIEFGDVPILSELTYGGKNCITFLFWSDQHPKYNNHLEKLVLHVSYEEFPISRLYFDAPFGSKLIFQRLKQLDLVLNTADYPSLLYFVLLTKALPFLSRFVAQFKYELGQIRKQVLVAALCTSKEAEAKLNNHHHKYLKVVKLKDFACYRAEYRFARSLLQIAKSLEKVVIAPGRGYLGAERITTVRERIMQLKANLPPGAELVVL